jgi:hypothetical protein
MSTIWNSKKANNHLGGNVLTCWSRQLKLATIAGFVMLAVLVVVGICLRQSQQTGLAAVSGTAPIGANSQPRVQSPAQATPAVSVPVAQVGAKKPSKKHSANISYADTTSGVSFVYPRKFALITGEKAQRQFEANPVPMNFVQSGGAAVATVELPKALFPGTDFETGFFSVNVNRSLSEEQCSHFAFVDTSDADGEPIDAEKVKVGSADMNTTSEFAGSATKQSETQYYHAYENGSCFEYVLGLGTSGYGTIDGLEPVNRDEVFARLEKILTTVKVRPVADGPRGEPALAGTEAGK